MIEPQVLTSPAAWRLRDWGRHEYVPVWRAMQAYNEARDAHTADELWLVEHPPVYTLGLAGKEEHLIDAGSIPVVRVDRGGQVTYHGPGQVVLYTLLDLRRHGLGVRELVMRLEQAVITLLTSYGIYGVRRTGAPGVYVGAAKIAAVGLRVRQGCCYHGLSLNVDLDLAPYARINPCGYAGLAVTQLGDLGGPVEMHAVGSALAAHVAAQFDCTLMDASNSIPV